MIKRVLFLEKLHEYGDSTIDDFLAYFKREKLEFTRNWYEAVAMCVPSTSNGIESKDRNIKEDDTFRERWPLGRFCVKSLDIVHNWSADRNPTNVNCKNFNFLPILVFSKKFFCVVVLTFFYLNLNTKYSNLCLEIH